MKVEIGDVIRAPLERVWALSTDIDRAGEWLPKHVVVEKLTEGPARVGSRYRESRPILGRRDVRVYEITILDAPRRSEVFAAEGGFRFRVDYEARGASTAVTMSGDVTVLGCLGVVAAPLVRHVMRRNMAVDLAGLKAWIERT
ncbi:MAG TPA: SRPBCC family protein [Planctomycetota bacterium]